MNKMKIMRALGIETHMYYYQHEKAVSRSLSKSGAALGLGLPLTVESRAKF